MPVNINLLPDEVIARGITGADWSKAPGAFWAGQDQAQKEQERNLFSGGLPRVPGTNDIDYRQMAEMLARSQGAGAIPTLASLRTADIQQQALNQNAGMPDIFPPLPTQPRVQLPPSTGRPPGQAPSQSSLESDQGGGEPARPGQANLTSDTEVPGSARMSVDGGPMLALTSEPQPAPTVRQFSQNPVTGPPTERFTPPPQPAPQQVAQARTPPPPGIAPPIPPITNQNDPGYWTLENARAYDRAAYIFNMRAQNLGVGGLAAGAAGPKQQAEQLAARAAQIYDHIGKSEEPTPEIKQFNLGKEPGETLPGYQARTKGMETLATEDVKDFRKEAVSIQAAGRNAFSGLQKAQLAKNLTLDPNFYSGPLQPTVQTYQQFRAIFGNNPSAALPQEAFQKEVSDLLQEQIKSMGQSGVGRVLMSEVAIMRQAVSSLGITPQSNRALLEISSRVYKQQQAIADIASKIKAPPGQMSNALDQSVGAHLSKNPLFTPDELRNPTLLGAPDAPPQSAQWSPQQRRMWAQGIGLKPGDPVRFNGQIGAVP